MWRPEDDEALPKGWTWKTVCQYCAGPMPKEPVDRFCSEFCASSFDEELDLALDEDPLEAPGDDDNPYPAP